MTERSEVQKHSRPCATKWRSGSLVRPKGAPVTDFSLEVFQNEYVPAQATTMDAVVTVASQGLAPVRPGEAAEILIIDTSGSMYSPPGRIRAAIRAAGLAVDHIRDGVPFGIVAGNHDATTVFPAWGSGLVVADAVTRAAAREAVRRLEPSGGTAMSKWLLMARDLFATCPTPRRHAILLTDGENNEMPGALEAVLQQCRGLFQVDCRGIGTDWVVGELRTIASTLLGTVDIIRDPEGVEAEFQALMEASMGRAAEATLRVWCPKGAAVSFVRQVAPDLEDLTGWGTQLDARTREYPLGAWGTEARDYHLSVSVPANQTGVEMLAARLSLVVDGARRRPCAGADGVDRRQRQHPGQPRGGPLQPTGRAVGGHPAGPAGAEGR